MKSLSLSILCFFLLSGSLWANMPDKEKAAIGVRACIYINGKIGIPDKGCRGYGLGCVDLSGSVDAIFDQVPPKPTKESKIRICFTYMTSDQLRVEFDPVAGEVVKDFVVDRPFVLNTQLANKLGSKEIKTLPGVYKAGMTSNGMASTTLKVTSKK